MTPGTSVTWTFPTQPGVKFIGKVLSRKGKNKAEVQAHGTLYEVDIKLLRPIKTCLHCDKPFRSKDLTAKYCSRRCYMEDHRITRQCETCGQPTGRPEAIYCSRRCFAAAQENQTDREVFAALVAYKKAHNGLSPTQPVLAKLALLHEQTVALSLNRLEAAGRIWYEGEAPYRGIGVKGGKWTYEEPQP